MLQDGLYKIILYICPYKKIFLHMWIEIWLCSGMEYVVLAPKEMKKKIFPIIFKLIALYKLNALVSKSPRHGVLFESQGVFS